MTCLEVLVYAFNDPRLVVVNDDNCNLHSDNTLRCIGHVKIAAAYPVTWQASVAYRCSDHRSPPLNLSYEVRLTPYENITCSDTDDIRDYGLATELTPMVDTLNTLYDSYSRWNFLGLSPANIRDISTLYPVLTDYTCYKYLEELVLRLMLPECRNGQVIYQCFEMCEDFRQGCGQIESALFFYTKGCFSLQHQGEGPCVYREVTCDEELVAPDNGYIEYQGNTTRGSTIKVHCNPGYTLSGNATGVCGYGGYWEFEKEPDCREIPETLDKSIIVAPIVVGCVLIAILIIAFIVYARYRYEVIVIIFKYCPWLLCCARFHKRYDIKLHDAIAVYHDDDEDFVKSNIQEPLEKQGFKLFVDYRDGMPGKPVLRYMADAIAQSHRVIIILSQQFLDDNRCGYMLDQAFYQTLEGQQFQVIIVLMDAEKNLKNIPRFVRVFMRAGGMVHKDDQMFLSSLSYKMPTKGVATVAEPMFGSSKINGDITTDLNSVLIE